MFRLSLLIVAAVFSVSISAQSAPVQSCWKMEGSVKELPKQICFQKITTEFKPFAEPRIVVEADVLKGSFLLYNHREVGPNHLTFALLVQKGSGYGEVNTSLSMSLLIDKDGNPISIEYVHGTQSLHYDVHPSEGDWVKNYSYVLQ